MKWVAPMKKTYSPVAVESSFKSQGYHQVLPTGTSRGNRENTMLMLHSWGNIFCSVIMMMYFFSEFWASGNLKLIHLCRSPKLQIVISEHKTTVTIILTDRHTAALWLLRGVRTVRLLKRHVFFGLIGSQLRRIWQLLQFAKWSANTIWLLRV